MDKRLEGLEETILEPALPIIDAHFHLFDRPELKYMLPEYQHDIQAGHNIIGSVYVETEMHSLTSGPEVLKPLGEIEFANSVGEECARQGAATPGVNAGIIAHAEMRMGDKVAGLFDKGLETAPERLKGFRNVALDHPHEAPYRFMLGEPERGLLQHPEFRNAFRHLAPRGLTFDITVFNTQLPDVIALADAFPETSIILDHLGMPMNLDASDDEQKEIFLHWRQHMRELAKRENVACKIGGLGMPFTGFGFEKKSAPVTSQELAVAWKPYVETGIEAFGCERSMMESNFPPDAYSSGYVPLWNAMKIITRSYSENEKANLYHRTARRVYCLNVRIPD